MEGDAALLVMGVAGFTILLVMVATIYDVLYGEDMKDE